MAKPKRILWVDDDAGGLWSPLRRRFEREGIEVDIAQDVATALHKIAAVEYDALLVDLILPYESGSSALSSTGYGIINRMRDLEARRGRPERVPVVILSVIGRDEASKEIVGLGVEHFDKVSLLEPGMFDRLVESLSGSGDAAEPEPPADDWRRR